MLSSVHSRRSVCLGPDASKLEHVRIIWLFENGSCDLISFPAGVDTTTAKDS